MIALERVAVAAGNFALREISLHVPAGAYAVLMGRTGAGKTTLLEAICGLKKVAGGRILLAGRDVTRLKPAERGVGYVPQDRALFTTMSVRENLAFALRIRRWSDSATALRVKELAAWLGLEPLLDRNPLHLSGGEAQRVALGRALAFRPAILLLDEPLSALDDATRQEMHQVLRSVREQTGVTTVHVTHNLVDAERLADRVMVLEGGAVRLARG